MKAIVCTKYGLSQLKIEEVEKPVPKDNEVRVEVHASSVTTANLIMISGQPFFVRLTGMGLFRPKIMIAGGDLAGCVEAVGKDVKQFQPGDEVFGEVSLWGSGAYAEYAAVPEHALVPKPANVSFEEAAAVPEAGLVALQGLRDKGKIQNGQKVLIYGASGGIGTFAVQIAKYFGAEVTAICSTGNIEMVRSTGADHVIDYTKEDFTKSGKLYDLIFAIPYRSVFDHLRALSPRGIYVSTGGPSISRIIQDMVIGSLLPEKGGKKVVGGWLVMPNRKDLTFIKELIEAGKIKPVIDRCYPLSNAADAFRYYGKGHARGKVVITMQHKTDLNKS